MKRILLSFLVLGCYVAYAANDIVPVYGNRFNFTLTRVGLEHMSPGDIYAGANFWTALTMEDDKAKFSTMNADAKIGYTVGLSGSSSWTPFVGVGYFHNFRGPTKDRIVFSSLGMIQEIGLDKVFSVGAQPSLMFGYCFRRDLVYTSACEFQWQNAKGYVWGVDVGIPLTVRFATKLNWDFRLEPFLTEWYAEGLMASICGFRGSIGYRF